MTRDPWLCSSSIFGLTQQVDEYSEKLKGVFAFIQPSQITSLLPNMAHVLASNEQLQLPGNMTHNLGKNGSFSIENKPELLEAHSELLANTLYNQNLIDMQEKYGLKFSLVEMLMNAVEHGNCEIDYQEKDDWLEQGKSMLQLIEKKCEDPAIASKRVTLTYEIGEERSTFVIKDEGSGFDVSKAPSPETSSLLDLHGRGIFMTRHYLESLSYNDIGNEVTLVINHLVNPEKIVPEGFLSSEIKEFKKGDTIFEKGDPGDILYYIISGDYDIIIDGRVVNTLNSTSVFLGEMAFLLGNRRTATVKSRTNARLVAVGTREWLNAVQKYPYYGIFLARLLAQKLERQTQNILDSGTQQFRTE
jgi:hypothetical protein